MEAVRDVSFSDFSEREGDVFRVAVGGDAVEMILDLALALKGSERPGGGFKLEFLGPAEPRLDQGVYPFEMGDGALDIFIVPIALEAQGLRYEAIFY